MRRGQWLDVRNAVYGAIALSILAALGWWLVARTRDSGVITASSLSSVPLISGHFQGLPLDDLKYRHVAFYGGENLYATGRTTAEGMRELTNRFPSVTVYEKSWDRMPSDLQDVLELIDGSAHQAPEWSKECWFLQGALTRQIRMGAGFDPRSGRFWMRVNLSRRGN